MGTDSKLNTRIDPRRYQVRFVRRGTLSKPLTYQLATHQKKRQGDTSRLLRAAAGGQLEMNIQHFASIDNDSLGDELSELVTRILVKANSTIRTRARAANHTVSRRGNHTR
jgi:hypothetical protein